jgi:hypothetical protein
MGRHGNIDSVNDGLTRLIARQLRTGRPPAPTPAGRQLSPGSHRRYGVPQAPDAEQLDLWRAYAQPSGTATRVGRTRRQDLKRARPASWILPSRRLSRW